MKKIIALLLALTCVFALAACGDEPDPTPTPDGGDNTNTYEDLAPFTAAIAASNPASASINVAQTSTQFNVTMNGEYDVVYNEDGSATVEYSYDKYNEITDDTTEVTTTVTGTATVDKDGNVRLFGFEQGAVGIDARLLRQIQRDRTDHRLLDLVTKRLQALDPAGDHPDLVQLLLCGKAIINVSVPSFNAPSSRFRYT